MVKPTLPHLHNTAIPDFVWFYMMGDLWAKSMTWTIWFLIEIWGCLKIVYTNPNPHVFWVGIMIIVPSFTIWGILHYNEPMTP
jgi:hypothetical protein